jgi:DNA polymerase elongation subunit (family B)
MQALRDNDQEKFIGAYVKEPIVGKYDWIYDLDLTSLYPSIIMTLNISPETKIGKISNWDAEQYIKGEEITYKLKGKDGDEYEYNRQELADVIKDSNLGVAANGVLYMQDKPGLIADILNTWFNKRVEYRKLEKKYGEEKNTELYEFYGKRQHVQKILLNSMYGVLGLPAFRFYDVDNAEAVTLTGQVVIKKTAEMANRKYWKELGTTDDYNVYIDTDSIYLSLETLIEKLCEGKTTEQKIKYMDKVCEEIFQPFIDNSYQELADYMNAHSQKMQMKREVLADQAIWTAKKRYILNVHNSEGVQYAKPKLKVMGLEMVKSSTPAAIRDMLRESIQVILKGSEEDLHLYIEEKRANFLKMPVEDIAFPRGVNGMKVYAGSPIYAKGTPIHVRGALLYNHHCKRMGLEKKYQAIRDGDKIKFVYMKMPNPIQEDVIAFVQHLPKELGLHAYIDYDKQFQKVFLDALQIVIEPLGWKTEKESSLEDFFA